MVLQKGHLSPTSGVRSCKLMCTGLGVGAAGGTEGGD